MQFPCDLKMMRLKKKSLMSYKIKSFVRIYYNHISLALSIKNLCKVIDRKSKLGLTLSTSAKTRLFIIEDSVLFQMSHGDGMNYMLKHLTTDRC